MLLSIFPEDAGKTVVVKEAGMEEVIVKGRSVQYSPPTIARCQSIL